MSLLAWWINSHFKFDMFQNAPPANSYSFAGFPNSINGDTLLPFAYAKALRFILVLLLPQLQSISNNAALPLGIFRRPLLSISVTITLGQAASIWAWIICNTWSPSIHHCTLPINSPQSQGEPLKTCTGSPYSPAQTLQWLPSHPEKKAKSLNFPLGVTLI